jgi:hypothetical protein
LTEDEAAELLAGGRAWDEFCDTLKTAGRIVLEHSPDHELDRAEGFRYLTRLLRMGFKLCLEHADPAAPRLIQYMDATQKFGVDNPDQLYQWARISGEYSYRLHGPRGTASYVGIGVYAGSAGRGGRRTVAHVDADELAPASDGGIDVVLSPDEHRGNWIALDPDTTTLLVRQTVNDVENEVTAELVLERLDSPGPPPPLRSSQVVKGMRRAAAQVIGSAQMFAALSDRWKAQPNVLHPMDVHMAEKSFGDPDLYYSGGYWRLAPDEALVIEFTPPECRYWGFLLCNYWAESLDYRYRPVATNKHRATTREDGSVKIIVARQDPGLADVTWLDTEGHTEGTMTLRWLLAEETPVPTPQVVKLSELLRDGAGSTGMFPS